MKTYLASARWYLGIVYVLVSYIPTGSSEIKLVGQSDPVFAYINYSAILPCYLEPRISAVNMIVEWTRTDQPGKVCVYIDTHITAENPAYEGRASMSLGLKNGDLSLILRRIDMNDTGNYTCRLPRENKETTIQLKVDSIDEDLSKPKELEELQKQIEKLWNIIRSSGIEVVGPSGPVDAVQDNNVTLPCYLEPRISAENMNVEWTRTDQTGKVCVYIDKRITVDLPGYEGRASMSLEELKNGNLSLILKRIKIDDTGTYTCRLPRENKETTIQLKVESIQDRLEQKKTELEQKKTELEQKKTELEQKKTELEQKKTELEELQKQIEELQKQIDKLRNKADKLRNKAVGAGAEVGILVGVGVLVGGIL